MQKSPTTGLDRPLVLSSIFLALGLIFFHPLLWGQIPGPFGWLNHWLPWNRPGITDTGNFIVSDQMDQFYPMLAYIKARLISGEIPWWNSSAGFGIPFFQLSIVGHWYPPALLCLIIFPLYLLWPALALVKFVLIGYFTYKLIRLYGLRQELALLSSISLAFSMYSIVWAGDYLSYSYSAIPLFFFAVTDFVLNGPSSLRRATVLISAILMILGSFPSIIFYAVFVGIFYVPVLLKGKVFSRPAFELIGLGLLAALICLPQLYYTAEYLSSINLSYRAKYIDFHFPEVNSILAFFPLAYGEFPKMLEAKLGNFNEKACYVGLAALLLSFLSWVYLFGSKEYRRSRFVWFWSLVQAWSVCMVWGYLGVLKIFGPLPIFNANSSTRLIGMTAFSTVILAAFAGEHLLSTKKYREFWISNLLFIAVAAALALIQTESLQLPWHILLQAALLIALLYLLNKAATTNSANAWILAVCALTFGNLKFLGQNYNGYYTSNIFYPNTAVTQYLADNLPPGAKFLALDRHFLPQTPLFYQFSTVETRWFMTDEQRALLKGIDPSYRTEHNTQHFFDHVDLEKAHSTLDFVNVKYLLTRNDRRSDRLPPGFVWAGEFSDQTALIENVERPYRLSDPEAACSDANLYNYSARDNQIKFTANRCTAGIVKLPVWNYPGWEIIQPNQGQILNQDGFMAVQLPIGRSEFQLRFRPSNLKLILLVSLSSLLLAVFLVKPWAWKQR